MISVQGISKRFGKAEALRPLSVSLTPQKTTALLGPSGCGKSTLLRIMIGLLEPDAGEVFFDGRAVTQHEWRTLRLKIGFGTQDGGLFPHLTARENALLVARHLRWSSERCETRLHELCALAHLPTSALDRYPAQLSGGQQQRVSLMRALLLDPAVLLLDEPLGALDPIVRRSLQSELRDIFRSLQKTVIFVTHDLGEAGYLGDEIVLMRRGTIEQHGTFHELVDTPANEFVREFVNAQRSPLDAAGERS